MHETSIPGDPLIEIARAIGRIEAIVSTAMAKQSDHEERISDLEEKHTKLSTQIALIGTLAGGAISAGAWVIEHWFLK